jgi:hypothetical protein
LPSTLDEASGGPRYLSSVSAPTRSHIRRGSFDIGVTRAEGSRIQSLTASLPENAKHDPGIVLLSAAT